MTPLYLGHLPIKTVLVSLRITLLVCYTSWVLIRMAISLKKTAHALQYPSFHLQLSFWGTLSIDKLSYFSSRCLKACCYFARFGNIIYLNCFVIQNEATRQLRRSLILHFCNLSFHRNSFWEIDKYGSSVSRLMRLFLLSPVLKSIPVVCKSLKFL